MTFIIFHYFCKSSLSAKRYGPADKRIIGNEKIHIDSIDSHHDCMPRRLRKIKDISITSCDIVSISPSGLRSLNGVFLVGIHNPVFKFAVSDIQGTVYHQGTAIIDFTANGFEVQKKSDDKHRISGIAELRPEISLLSALALLKDLNADSYTVDVSARVKAEGIKMTISRKDMPLSTFME